MAELGEAQGNGDASKVTGHFRPFYRRTRYRMPTSASTFGEKLVGSNSNLSVLSGSAQNLLDPAKMMSMQEDARSRKISSEVMKRCLYRSVAAPCRRRIANRMSCSITPNDAGGNSASLSAGFYQRKMLSLSVTPMESLRVTPSQSPTEDRRFFYGFLSHGPTPRSTSPVPFDGGEREIDARNEGDDAKGLASLFRPQPTCVVARVWSQQDCGDDAPGGWNGSRPEGRNSGNNDLLNRSKLRSSNSIIKRKVIDVKSASPV